MTRDEFISRHRPRLMGWLVECYATRREKPSEFGLTVDRQFAALNGLLGQIYTDLTPPVNGQVAKQVEVRKA